MTKTALFSVSTPDFVYNAEVSLLSFLEHCDYRDSIDIFNITVDEVLEEKKYSNTLIDKMCLRHKDNMDSMRWSLKPALLLYFLQDKGYKNSIYIDNDIYFVNNNTFLIEGSANGILLTKHHRPIVPHPDFFEINAGRIKYYGPISDRYYYEQFLCSFTDGYFNAGFIAANELSIPAIIWWSKMNYWQCVKSKKQGLYVDQKYLDIMALEFRDIVKICDHEGCNLATWNRDVLVRSKINDRWKINKVYDPIFLHFSSLNYSAEDPMLWEYCVEYQEKINNLKKQR